MIDIETIRKTPELVKENIKKKFQDHKLWPWTKEEAVILNICLLLLRN